LGGCMRLAIPARPQFGIADTEIGRQVDDAHAAPDQVRYRLHRDIVRGGEEHDIALRELVVVGHAELQIDMTAQVWIHVRHGDAGFGARGDRLQPDLRVLGQNPQQFDAGVAGAADDAYLDHGVTSSIKPGRYWAGSGMIKHLGWLMALIVAKSGPGRALIMPGAGPTGSIFRGCRALLTDSATVIGVVLRIVTRAERAAVSNRALFDPRKRLTITPPSARSYSPQPCCPPLSAVEGCPGEFEISGFYFSCHLVNPAQCISFIAPYVTSRASPLPRLRSASTKSLDKRNRVERRMARCWRRHGSVLFFRDRRGRRSTPRDA